MTDDDRGGYEGLIMLLCAALLIGSCIISDSINELATEVKSVASAIREQE